MKKITLGVIIGLFCLLISMGISHYNNVKHYKYQVELYNNQMKEDFDEQSKLMKRVDSLKDVLVRTKDSIKTVIPKKIVSMENYITHDSIVELEKLRCFGPNGVNKNYFYYKMNGRLFTMVDIQLRNEITAGFIKHPSYSYKQRPLK